MSICCKIEGSTAYYYNQDLAPFDKGLYGDNLFDAVSGVSGSKNGAGKLVLENALRPTADKDADPKAGRGPVLYRNFHGRPVVIKHYRRGGLVRYFSRDRYWFSGFNRSRVARELKLLDQMTHWQLPVPVPVAGRLERCGNYWYRAVLVTQQIDTVGSLADVLSRETMPHSQWESLAETLNEFHRHGIYHADLNASNILTDRQGCFHLIDFDRGYVASKRQRERLSIVSLKRFHRSLIKLHTANPTFGFDDADWLAFSRASIGVFRG